MKRRITAIVFVAIVAGVFAGCSQSAATRSRGSIAPRPVSLSTTTSGKHLVATPAAGGTSIVAVEFDATASYNHGLPQPEKHSRHWLVTKLIPMAGGEPLVHAAPVFALREGESRADHYLHAFKVSPGKYHGVVELRVECPVRDAEDKHVAEDICVAADFFTVEVPR